MKKGSTIIFMMVALLLLTGCIEETKEENATAEVKAEATITQKVTDSVKETATVIIESVSDTTEAVVEKTKELLSDSHEMNSSENNQTVE